MKSYFDIFNGDADGICALHQLRLAKPQNSILISGVKRDISLLKQVDPNIAQQVTVLDISLDKNKTALDKLLSQGVNVFYVDHHHVKKIPSHSCLISHIHNNANTCTSLIVDNLLNGQFHEWAIVGAYGDNLIDKANQLSAKAHLTQQQQNQLKHLGTYINYNGYGSSISDLFFPPIELYSLIKPFTSPFSFIKEREDIYHILEQGFLEDSEKAATIKPYSQQQHSRVFMLPNMAWARRISGVYSNNLANQDPNIANAVITAKENNQYLVSIRAPLNRRTGADKLASLFSTGGGRKAAAGINALPAEQLSQFITSFHQQYQISK